MHLLYHISELQTAVQEVTATPQSYKQPNKGWVFRAGGNFHRPFLAPMPKCHEVRAWS